MYIREDTEPTNLKIIITHMNSWAGLPQLLYKIYLFQTYDRLLKFSIEWEQAVYSSSFGCPSTDQPPFPMMTDLKTAIRGMKALCQLAIDIDIDKIRLVSV